MKSLFVGGRFDEYMGKFSEQDYKLSRYLNVDDVFNGGNINILNMVLDKIPNYEKVFWFAHTPGKNGMVKQVKRRNGKAFLVNGIENSGRYSFADLMQNALDSRSNLVVEVNNEKARVLDPLANMFLDYTSDMSLVGRVLNERLNELQRYSREGSEEVTGKSEIPNDMEFFEVVREKAARFQELIHQNPENNHRFYGNASFRCERGFPSFRKEGFVYVSRRNVDKKEIGREDFVKVRAENPVRYYGKNKPSVDTPVQLKLYEYYGKARYMLHGHVYVENAEFTDKIVPCGALEEAEEIMRLHLNKEEGNFAVNLLGHGSLVVAENLRYLSKVNYVKRDMPEFHSRYLKGGENGR